MLDHKVYGFGTTSFSKHPGISSYRESFLHINLVLYEKCSTLIFLLLNSNIYPTEWEMSQITSDGRSHCQHTIVFFFFSRIVHDIVHHTKLAGYQLIGQNICNADWCMYTAGPKTLSMQTA
jgi:hypothetical protein